MAKRTVVTDPLRLEGQAISAGLSDTIESIRCEYAIDAVSQLVIRAADPEGVLAASPLVQLQTRLVYAGEAFDISSFDGEWFDWGVMWEIRARTQLARRLRSSYKVTADRTVSPSDWVRRTVGANRGTAITQPTASRAAISQRGGDDRQSALDVIGSLAGELDWSWAEYDERLYFASRSWMHRTGSGTRTWPITWDRAPETDALTFTWTQSDDDTANRGSIDVGLPYAHFKEIRPFDRIRVTGTGSRDGTYLVETVTVTHDDIEPVQVTATIPKPPSPKRGSAGRKK